MKITEEMLRAWLEAQIPEAEADVERTRAELYALLKDWQHVNVITCNEASITYTEEANQEARVALCEALGKDPNDEELTEGDLYEDSPASDALLAQIRLDGLESGLEQLDSMHETWGTKSVEEIVKFIDDHFSMGADDALVGKERSRINERFEAEPHFQLDILHAIATTVDDDDKATKLVLTAFANHNRDAMKVIDSLDGFAETNTDYGVEGEKMLEQAARLEKLGWYGDDGEKRAWTVVQIARTWAGGLPVIYGKLQAD